MNYLPSLKNKFIAIPYNNDPSLIGELGGLLIGPRPFGVYIYFAPNPKVANAGRRTPNANRYVGEDGKFDGDKFDEELILALRQAKKLGFKNNLLLNNVLLGIPHSDEGMKNVIPRIQSYLENLYSKGLLDRITLSNPYLLELINWKRMPRLEIKTSVNFQIKSSKTIELIDNISNFWLDRRIDCIEIQKDLLRNTDSLRQIKKAVGKNTKLSIIINEGCLTGCPYQMAHQLFAFSIPSSDIRSIQDKPSFNIAKCKNITSREPWRILDSNWIIPQWLKYYSKTVDEFKLTDRRASTEDILYIVKSYVTGEYDKNNLCRLISMLRMEKFRFPESALPETFFKKVSDGTANQAYFKKIWSKIDDFNQKHAEVALPGLKKEGLHRFIGND